MIFERETIHIDTWPAIFAVLAPSLNQTGESVTDLIDLLLSGADELWVLRKGGDPIAVAVSELESTPKGQLVHLRLIAGKNMGKWLGGAIATITAYARVVGAIGVRGEARPGMAKALARHGWKQTRSIMELSLLPEEVHCGR
jgi:hypothetical protein